MVGALGQKGCKVFITLKINHFVVAKAQDSDDEQIDKE